MIIIETKKILMECITDSFCDCCKERVSVTGSVHNTRKLHSSNDIDKTSGETLNGFHLEHTCSYGSEFDAESITFTLCDDCAYKIKTKLIDSSIKKLIDG